MTLPALALLTVAVLAATLAATGIVRHALHRRAILDHPNERSSHQVPTPRGGGWALVPIVVVAWFATAALNGVPVAPVAVIGGLALGLGALSWLDDLRDLSPLWRLLGQGVAVTLALLVLDRPGLFFNGLLPPSLDAGAAALLWLWYINLFNFMDGIDGISGVEAATSGGGIALIAILAGLGPTLPAFGLIVAAAALGFLWWNWQPARIFLGDVGSVPLGFLLGWLLLSLAARGEWAPALILPLYYLADATITLIRRALRGETVWRPHREHFYQQAVRKGASHASVSLTILAVDLGLVGLATAATLGWRGPSIAGAVLLVAALLIFLRNGAGAPTRPESGSAR